MNKNILFFCAVFLLFFLGISCKKNGISEKGNDKNTHYFLGDSTMAQSDYFKLIAGENGYTILKKQSKLYQQKYFDSPKDNLPEITKGKLTIKLVKINSKDQCNTKILLYTFFDRKKIDSLQFYRSCNNVRYTSDKYTCLSYFDEKTNTIRQVRYFSYDKDQQWDIAVSEQSTILPDGKIKSDSLFHLDELLDLEMDKHHLYY